MKDFSRPYDEIVISLQNSSKNEETCFYFFFIALPNLLIDTTKTAL